MKPTLLAVAVIALLAGLGALWWMARAPGPIVATSTSADAGSGVASADEATQAMRAGDPTGPTGPTGAAGASGAPPALPAVDGVVPRPPRGDGMPSSELPRTPPARYTLSGGDGGPVFVDLRGGASTMRAVSTLGAHDPTRTLRGHVVDASGRPLAGAIVLAGPSLAVIWANVQAETGATTDADGGFELAVATGAIGAVAITPQAWSAIAWVPAGDHPAPVVLALAAPARVRVAVTRAHAPERATLTLGQVGHERETMMQVDTGAGGVFDSGPFAPGAYVVTAGLDQMMEGGASAKVRHALDVVPGRTAALDVELASGALPIVHAPLPDGAEGTVEFSLARGVLAPMPTTAGELRPGKLDGSIDAVMFGGSSLTAPMQFHDRPPGDYTLCVETKLRTPAVAGFRCQPVAITADQAIVEVTVELGLAPAPAGP